MTMNNMKNNLSNSLVFIVALLPGLLALILHFVYFPGLPFQNNPLSIGSSNGSKILISTALDDAPRAIFYDADGNASLTIQLTPTGVPMISMNSPNGGRAINISTALEDGRPQIMLFNPENGKPVWSVKVDKEGKPVITDHTLSDN